MATEITLWLVMTAIGVGIAGLWAFLDHRKSTRIAGRQQLLHRLAEKAGLSLTGEESIAGGLMGYDSAQGTLLVLQFEGGRPLWYTLPLADVVSCMVLTVYKVLPTAITNLYSINQQIDQVALQLEFGNGEAPALLPFYSARHHSLAELPEQEARARKWHRFLTDRQEEMGNRA